MYRVELKASLSFVYCLLVRVPNVPCGVERIRLTIDFVHEQPVPNVPCGVESKGFFKSPSHTAQLVPNVPCGVES